MMFLFALATARAARVRDMDKDKSYAQKMHDRHVASQVAIAVRVQLKAQGQATKTNMYDIDCPIYMTQTNRRCFETCFQRYDACECNNTCRCMWRRLVSE